MTTKQIPIWIDCDTGTDDTVAIMLAHALPELQIVGLSAVAGNSLLCNTFPNTRRKWYSSAGRQASQTGL